MSSPNPHPQYQKPSSEEIREWVESGTAWENLQARQLLWEQELREFLSESQWEDYLLAKGLVARALASEEWKPLVPPSEEVLEQIRSAKENT